jgi:hypothetical protein
MFSTLLRGYSGNNWWCVISLCGGIVTSTLCSAYGKAIKKYACTFWKYFFFCGERSVGSTCYVSLPAVPEHGSGSFLSVFLTVISETKTLRVTYKTAN